MTVETNTLIFTGLPERVFLEDGKPLKELLDPYKSLQKMVLLKSFGRVLCVFGDTLKAINIKNTLHKTSFLDKTMLVYYGMVKPLT